MNFALPLHSREHLFYFSLEQKQDNANAVGSTKASDDELTCSVCLEQVNVGELIRSLPCLHQVAS
jgi:E3 ubiquitin-protein ligase SDIR1